MNESIEDQLRAFDTVTVSVVGDVMLDSYIHGEVERISPEAPVPVVRSHSERDLPGGAANVAVNLATLGVDVELVGLTGRDASREKLTAVLAASGRVDVGGLIADPARATTRKLRILGGRQQVVRVDFEDVAFPEPSREDQLIAAARASFSRSSAVILSDYGKGVLSDRVLKSLLGAAREFGRRLLVDPKRRDWAAYAGAGIITPNARELSEATSLPCNTDTEVVRACGVANAVTGADILVTRSEKGMSFVPVNGPVIHLATVARNVFDVSGAGDTVIAVFTAALSAGFDVGNAMKLANHAAGVVIAKVGAASATRAEIAASLAPRPPAGVDIEGEKLSLSEAVALRNSWGEEGLSVGFTNGCFDLVHPGHISLIRQAAASCDRLIVALNSDASVRRLKGPTRPLQRESARVDVIGAIRGVAAVVVFAEDTPREAIMALRPDVLVKGADYAEGEVVGGDFVKANGGKILLAALVPGHSTTAIANRRAMVESRVEPVA